MPKRSFAENFFPTGDDRLFIDTNIWLKLHGPSPFEDKKFRVYSKLLGRALDKNVRAKLGTSLSVISEFINRFCRDDWKSNYFSDFPDYKIFRASAEFAMTAKTAVIAARGILACSNVISFEDGSETASRAGIEACLDAFLSGKIDFNDAAIVEACRKHDYTLRSGRAHV